MKNIEIQDLDKKSDERGWLIEVLGGTLPEGCEEFGQLHVSVAYPGKVRGNHYHTRKVEWFCVPTGTGLLFQGIYIEHGVHKVRRNSRHTISFWFSDNVDRCMPLNAEMMNA